MSESVIYADINFKNFKKDTTFNANRTPSDPIDTEISIFRAGRQDPHEVDAAAPQLAGQCGRSKVKSGGCNPKIIALVLLCVLLAAAVVCLWVLYMQTNQKLQAFMVHQKTGSNGTYFQSPSSCAEGWLPYGKHWYFFSEHKYTWAKSREQCQKMCGDLVKVETREEQEFLEKTLQGKMKEDEDKFWIGLTDEKEEGKWFWADGSPLKKSQVFWSTGEPDNGKQSDEEDCARMGEKGGAKYFKCWFDKSCNVPHRMICEKPM